MEKLKQGVGAPEGFEFEDWQGVKFLERWIAVDPKSVEIDPLYLEMQVSGAGIFDDIVTFWNNVHNFCQIKHTMKISGDNLRIQELIDPESPIFIDKIIESFDKIKENFPERNPFIMRIVSNKPPVDEILQLTNKTHSRKDTIDLSNMDSIILDDTFKKLIQCSQTNAITLINCLKQLEFEVEPFNRESLESDLRRKLGSGFSQAIYERIKESRTDHNLNRITYPVLEKYLKLFSYRNIPGSEFLQSYGEWSDNHTIKTPSHFIYDKSRRKLAKKIRNKILHNIETTKFVHLTGPPGIGKTRFIYETLKNKTMRDRVLYLENIQNLQQIWAILKSDASKDRIFVIDDCDIKSSRSLENYFTNNVKNITFIIVDEDISRFQNAFSIQLDPLDNQEMRFLIEKNFPDLPAELSQQLLVDAEGYPSLVVMIVEDYRQNPKLFDLSSHMLSPIPIFNRLIGGNLSFETEEFQTIKKVMMHIAIFFEIGIQGDSESEDEILSEKLGHPNDLFEYKKSYSFKQEAEWLATKMGISFAKFKEIVMIQQKRGIINGKTRIFIRPFILAKFLSSEWWKLYGEQAINLINALKSLPFEHDLLFNFFFMLSEVKLGDNKQILPDINNFILEIIKIHYHRHSMFDYSLITELLSFLFEFYEKISRGTMETVIHAFSKNINMGELLILHLLSSHRSILPEFREKTLAKLVKHHFFAKKFVQYLTSPIEITKKSDLALAMTLRNRRDVAEEFEDFFVMNFDRLTPSEQDFFDNLIQDPIRFNRLLWEISSNRYIDSQIRDNLWTHIIKRIENANAPWKDLYSEITRKIIGFPNATLPAYVMKTFINDEKAFPYFAWAIFYTKKEMTSDILDNILDNIRNSNSPSANYAKSIIFNSNLPDSIKERTNAANFEVHEKEFDDFNAGLIEFNKSISERVARINSNIQRSSKKYQPNPIKILILSDYPHSNDLFYFFYNPYAKKPSFFFRTIMDVIYFEKNIHRTKEYLMTFQEEGFFLDFVSHQNLDFCTSLKEKTTCLTVLWESQFKDWLCNNITKKTPIILIGETTNEAIYPLLVAENYNVINKEVIPYPEKSTVKSFNEKFKIAILQSKQDLILKR